jgi:hypothetical protein
MLNWVLFFPQWGLGVCVVLWSVGCKSIQFLVHSFMQISDETMLAEWKPNRSFNAIFIGATAPAAASNSGLQPEGMSAQHAPPVDAPHVGSGADADANVDAGDADLDANIDAGGASGPARVSSLEHSLGIVVVTVLAVALVLLRLLLRHLRPVRPAPPRAPGLLAGEWSVHGLPVGLRCPFLLSLRMWWVGGGGVFF